MLTTAQLRLTLWYLAILAAIIGLLSLVLYRILISLQQAELQAVRPTVRVDIAQLFARDEGTLVVQILALDSGILILAALGAYVLAGRTLDPIARVLARQQRFAAAASHELRTPLTVLQGSIDVALLSRRTVEEYEQALRQAATETQRMAALVTDLLMLARPVSDAGALSMALVDLRDVIVEVGEALHPVASRKEQTLEVRPGRSLIVQGDALKLRQAISNLLDNAVAYTPAGGTVAITGSREHNRVQIQIRDTGPGIAPEHLRRLFEPFYRVDRARGGGTGHAGLGLALTEWIVQAHRGRLTVESTPGAGSVFTIELPAAS